MKPIALFTIAVVALACVATVGAEGKPAPALKGGQGSGVFQAAPSQAFILVSDVDDTVKITNVLHRREAVINAVTSKSVFAGMPQLYHAILGDTSPAKRLMFLSGSPLILHHKISEFLSHNTFPHFKLALRSVAEFINCPEGCAYDYKEKRMQAEYGSSRNNFILIGDDTECDPEVYADFANPTREHGQVLAIYIHRITGRELPSSTPPVVTFVTAYDIALQEFLANRLGESDAIDVGEAVLRSAKSSPRSFLPDFQACPKQHEEILGLPDSLAQLKNKIEAKVEEFCSQKRKCECPPPPCIRVAPSNTVGRSDG
jgi:uncharacterized protein DUF2183